MLILLAVNTRSHGSVHLHFAQTIDGCLIHSSAADRCHACCHLLEAPWSQKGGAHAAPPMMHAAVSPVSAATRTNRVSRAVLVRQPCESGVNARVLSKNELPWRWNDGLQNHACHVCFFVAPKRTSFECLSSAGTALLLSSGADANTYS